MFFSKQPKIMIWWNFCNFFNPSLHLLEEVTKTGNREGATSNEHRERENDNWEQNLS